MTAPQPAVGVAEVIARIRAEADRRREIEAAAGGPGGQSDTEEPFPARRKYALGEFLDLEKERFVRAVYQGLLRRAPEPAELADGLDRLRSGRLTRVELLVALRRSPEGRRHGVKVADLDRRRRLERLRRLPLLGPVVAWAVALIRRT
jgi:hypothetical protein